MERPSLAEAAHVNAPARSGNSREVGWRRSAQGEQVLRARHDASE